MKAQLDMKAEIKYQFDMQLKQMDVSRVKERDNLLKIVKIIELNYKPLSKVL